MLLLALLVCKELQTGSVCGVGKGKEIDQAWAVVMVKWFECSTSIRRSKFKSCCSVHFSVHYLKRTKINKKEADDGSFRNRYIPKIEYMIVKTSKANKMGSKRSVSGWRWAGRCRCCCWSIDLTRALLSHKILFSVRLIFYFLIDFKTTPFGWVKRASVTRCSPIFKLGHSRSFFFIFVFSVQFI